MQKKNQESTINDCNQSSSSGKTDINQINGVSGFYCENQSDNQTSNLSDLLDSRLEMNQGLDHNEINNINLETDFESSNLVKGN